MNVNFIVFLALLIFCVYLTIAAEKAKRKELTEKLAEAVSKLMEYENKTENKQQHYQYHLKYKNGDIYYCLGPDCPTEIPEGDHVCSRCRKEAE